MQSLYQMSVDCCNPHHHVTSALTIRQQRPTIKHGPFFLTFFTFFTTRPPNGLGRKYNTPKRFSLSLFYSCAFFRLSIFKQNLWERGTPHSIDLLLWAAIKYWPAFLEFLSLLYPCTSFSDGIFDPFRCWEDDTLSGTTPVSLGRHQSLSRSLQSIYTRISASRRRTSLPYLLAAAGPTQNHFPSILNAVDRGTKRKKWTVGRHWRHGRTWRKTAMETSRPRWATTTVAWNGLGSTATSWPANSTCVPAPAIPPKMISTRFISIR